MGSGNASAGDGNVSGNASAFGVVVVVLVVVAGVVVPKKKGICKVGIWSQSPSTTAGGDQSLSHSVIMAPEKN